MRITLHNIDRMTDEELENAITACFDASPETTQIDRLAILLEAQFYRTEKYKRAEDTAQAERDRVETDRWRIDLKNEKIIIGMIAGEIILSLLGIWLALSADSHQSEQATKQLAALQVIETNLGSLQKSSSATAETLIAVRDTMQALQKTSEGMSSSLAKQVALFYDMQINVVYNEGTKKLVLINGGRANVTLWSQLVGEEKEAMTDYPNAVTIIPNGSYEIPLESGVKRLTAELPKGQVHIFTFVFFVKNEKQEKFTISGDLIGIWKNDLVSFNTQQHPILLGWKK